MALEPKDKCLQIAFLEHNHAFFFFFFCIVSAFVL